MNLYTWAKRWNIPLAALQDLKQQLGYDGTPAPPDAREMHSEQGVTKAVRLEAAGKGAVLWRNNVGVMQDEHGNVVRFGLCNESSQLNKKFKSSDLVGLRPVTITPEMVGTILGQFVAREVKAPGWKYSGTAREEAQLRFLQLVLTHGGDACFTTGEGSL